MTQRAKQINSSYMVELATIPVPALVIQPDNYHVLAANQAANELLALYGHNHYLSDFINLSNYGEHLQALIKGSVNAISLPLIIKNNFIAGTLHCTVLTPGNTALILIGVTATQQYPPARLSQQTDDLTGLLTRDSFYRQLQLILQESQTLPAACFLGFIDLTTVKTSCYLHSPSDSDWCLITAASLLRSVLRSHDLAGRVNENSFAVIFTQCSRQYAEYTLKSVQQQLKLISRTIHKSRRAEAQVGLIVLESWMEADAATLLKMVDTTIYKYRQPVNNVVQLHAFRN